MSLTPALALVHALLMQAPSPGDSGAGFWRKSDARLAIATVVAGAAIAPFDERIARWVRQPAIQGDSSRRQKVLLATVVNEMPLTVASMATYGIGRLAGWPVVADVGAHLTETLVSTIVVVEAIRIPLGRARPRVSPDDAFDFHFMGGWTRFEQRAFPSLHAAAGFATAACLSQEMRFRDVRARQYVSPALYALATVPGFTRMYLDQHWTSDILVGTVIGTFLGNRVTQYAHGRRTRLDRFLLGSRVDVRAGEFSVRWSMRR